MAQAERPASATIQELQELVADVIAKTERSVVAIARVGKEEADAGFQIPNLGQLNLAARLDESLPTNADFVPTEYAAGVVIAREGLVVTTYHVLGNVAESEYYVWSQNRPFRARVLAADGWFDLAVLKVDALDLEPITLGDADSLEKGHFVVALGNPQAQARDGRASAAWGIVANLRRRAPRVPERSRDAAGRETVHHYGTMIQTDIRLHSGFAGGALVNLQGELVGLTTAYAGGPMEEEAAGLAIPVDKAFRQALVPLKSGKSAEFGFLGVGSQPLSLRLRQQGYHGVVIETVMPGTPAAREDIQNGDILTHADGQPLYDDDDLFRVIGSMPPEQLIALTIYRGDLAEQRGEVVNRTCKLSKKQVATLRPSFSSVPPERWRGMTVDYSTVAPRELLQSEHFPAAGSVYVTEVDPHSAVWRAGIRSGMFVVDVGGQPVTTPGEFFEAVRKIDGEVAISVTSGTAPARVQSVSP